jgi:dolichol-phosphate mannosyltransferase
MLSSSISDYTTGYNLIKIDILKKINLKKINSRGYSFLAELKYKIYKIDNNVVEIPITFNDRKFGKSKLPKSTIPATLILPFKLKNNK